MLKSQLYAEAGVPDHLLIDPVATTAVEATCSSCPKSTGRSAVAKRELAMNRPFAATLDLTR